MATAPSSLINVLKALTTKTVRAVGKITGTHSQAMKRFRDILGGDGMRSARILEPGSLRIVSREELDRFFGSYRANHRPFNIFDGAAPGIANIPAGTIVQGSYLVPVNIPRDMHLWIQSNPGEVGKFTMVAYSRYPDAAPTLVQLADLCAAHGVDFLFATQYARRIIEDVEGIGGHAVTWPIAGPAAESNNSILKSEAQRHIVNQRHTRSYAVGKNRSHAASDHGIEVAKAFRPRTRTSRENQPSPQSILASTFGEQIFPDFVKPDSHLYYFTMSQALNQG